MNLDILRDLKQPIFYVTNDVGKGVGLEDILPNYHFVCLDDHPLIDILQNSGYSVFCLERVLGEKNIIFRNTGEILNHPAVLSFIKEKSKDDQPNILFFKPQTKIENIANRMGFNLIGCSVAVNRQFEDKLAFFKLCRRERLPIPDGEILRLTEAKFNDLTKKYGDTLVIQFGRGWAGNSTFFISDEFSFGKLQKKFGQILVKIGRFIKGITVLNNAVIFRNQVFVSEPALQIKAGKNLTATQGGTGGRQWPAGLSKEQKQEIVRISTLVGKIMAKGGYQGFFGLDFLLEKSTGKIFLSENNARLTASVPFYTKLELREKSFPLLGLHLLSYLPSVKIENFDFSTPEVLGGEIIARNTSGQKVKINGFVETGIYTRNFDLKTRTHYLSSDADGDFWLETAAQGRIVNPEIEIVKIDTFAKVCDFEGTLDFYYEKIIQKVKEKLKIEIL